MAINEKAKQILEHLSKDAINSNSRGKLKIFLGMVAGVGKTCAMINAATAQKKSGKDVIIGLIVTHGRAGTEELVRGLDSIPMLNVSYKGKIFQEIDIQAIIQRRPDIVLIDELAHTNIPGSLHEKRYQDVYDILNAGIDVFTALNVQHIESCAGLIENITNVSIKETVPDTVLDCANDIVLVDIDPDQIIERLKEGKIYPPAKIQSSLDNFFKKRNLIALRETVLRLLADRVNVELRDFKIANGIPQIWKTSFRILVPILSSTEGEYLIRMTRRIASGLSARWVAAQIKGAQKNSDLEESIIRKNYLLAKQLGADVYSIYDNNFFDGIGRIIQEYQITHLIISRKQKKLTKQIKLLNNLYKEVDIILLSVEKNKDAPSSFKNNIWIILDEYFNLEFWSSKNFIISFFVLFLLTFVLFQKIPIEQYHTAGMIYLLFLCLNSIFSGPYIVILTSLLTCFLWNFLFIPPRFTLFVHSTNDILTLIGFLLTSLIIGLQTVQLKKKEQIAQFNDARTSLLQFLTRNLFETTGYREIIELTLERMAVNFNIEVGIIFADNNDINIKDEFVVGSGQKLDEKELSVCQWVHAHGKNAGRFTDTLNSVQGIYFPLRYKNTAHGVLCINPLNNFFNSNDMTIFEDIAHHMALIMGKEKIEKEK